MFSSYRLSRIPQDSSLNAWNAADELIFTRLSAQPLDRLLLVNDAFGALALGFEAFKPYWWNDSAMSEQALYRNCADNNIEPPFIIDDLVNEEEYRTVIIHVPKSINLFQWQLQQCQARLAQGGKIFAIGMVKHISKGHIDVMNKLFQEVNPGHATKKARTVELSQSKICTPLPNSSYFVPELEHELTNFPGCFAEKTIDQGGRVFVDHFDQLPVVTSAIDLGCGNGLLSASLLSQQPLVQLMCVDESKQALESAKHNIQHHYADSNVAFVHSNSLDKVDIKVDLILCNPPFHQENTLTEEIALTMFQDAQEHLNAKGELWVVANRNLAYFPKLSKIFSNVVTNSNNRKFTIYQCTK